jgi:hypothetical protein
MLATEIFMTRSASSALQLAQALHKTGLRLQSNGILILKAILVPLHLLSLVSVTQAMKLQELQAFTLI